MTTFFVRTTVSLLQLICIYWRIKKTTFNVWQYWVQQNLDWQPLPIYITDIYVIIMCIFHLFIDSSISVSNTKHSMLYFYKGNTVLLERKCQGILPTVLFASLVIHNSFYLMYILKIYPTWNISFTIYIWRIVLFNNNIIKIPNIYVRITVSLFRYLYLFLGRKTSTIQC